MKKISLILLMVFLGSCASISGTMSVDGSTPASTERTLNKIRAKIPTDQKPMFELALLKIQWDGESSLLSIVDKKALLINYEILAPKIDGLDYKTIMELGTKSSPNVKVQL